MPGNEKMSQTSSVDGKSPRGYLKAEEAVRGLNKGAVIGIASIFVLAFLSSLAETAEKMPDGTWREIITGAIVATAIYVRTWFANRAAANEGSDSDGGEY